MRGGKSSFDGGMAATSAVIGDWEWAMFWIAGIETDRSNHTGIHDALPTNLAFESDGGNTIRIGHPAWDVTTAIEKLLCAKALMMLLADLPADETTSLTFLFSGQTTQANDVPALLQQWNDTGDPPVLSIIALVLGAERVGHQTHGLAAFVGYELAAGFSDETFSRDAARDLARLARYILMSGDVRANQEFIGVNGSIVFLGPDDPMPDCGYWIRRIAMAPVARIIN